MCLRRGKKGMGYIEVCCLCSVVLQYWIPYCVAVKICMLDMKTLLRTTAQLGFFEPSVQPRLDYSAWYLVVLADMWMVKCSCQCDPEMPPVQFCIA